MKLISFFKEIDNSVMITEKLLSLLGVSATKTGIEKDLVNHPDYPSLLSISDVLTSYGVENVTLKSSIEKLYKIPLPCIVPIRDQYGTEKFSIVTSIEDKSVNFYDTDSLIFRELETNTFEKLWLGGIVMIVDAEDAKGEESYDLKRKIESRNKVGILFSYIILPVLTFFICGKAFLTYGISSIFFILYTLLTLVGMLVAVLIILFDLKEYSPVLQRICSGGEKSKCGAILNSKGASIFGISWSIVGFTYFSGALLSLLTLEANRLQTLFILSWLNILAIPYIFFSIFYQAKVAKQWCVLCLAVQVVLILQILVGFSAEWSSKFSNWTLVLGALIPIVIFFILSFLIITFIIGIYRESKENKQKGIELQRIKNNSEIFEALLIRQKQVIENTNGLGILLGNPNPIHKIIKVCNPYCEPCAQVHIQIEELLKSNPEIQLQIIFTSSVNDNDVRTPPVKHLLALAEKGNQSYTQQALNDWYGAEIKDYNLFSAKYPIPSEFLQQGEKIAAMSNWCTSTDIRFTPTFFINGYQLPEIYSADDLKYFLSV